MTSNKALLEKADLTLADLQTNGGLMTAEQGNSFIRKLIVQPTLLRQARVVEMTASQMKINKIQFGSRILRKATSATALPDAQRSSPTTEQIELNSKEQIAEVHLPYDALEDNIERATAANNEGSNTGPGGLRDTIITMIAERAALDLEELSILGDTAYVNGGDAVDQAYISQVDGFLKIAETSGNVADISNAAVSKAVFKQGIKDMPDQYLRNRSKMRHFISMDNETEYRDTLADRGTSLGDNMTTGLAAAYAYGSPVEAVSLMPETKGLFTDPKNLIFGIQRQVSMEYDKDIRSRVYIIVLTIRMDVQIEEAEASVVYNNIGTA